jgi:hypothetical protein
MAVILNASTTAGLVTSADTSGNLDLQSGGVTKIAVTSSGASVTGTLSASGIITGASFSGSASGLTGINTQLVTNGTFDSNTTGWSTGHASISSVSGGIDGNNCLQVTATDTSGSNWAQQLVSGFTSGRCYTFCASVKSGTSGNQAFEFKVMNGGQTLENAKVIGTSSANWTTYAGSFIATGTSHYFMLMKNSTTNSATMLFDSAMIY